VNKYLTFLCPSASKGGIVPAWIRHCHERVYQRCTEHKTYRVYDCVQCL